MKPYPKYKDSLINWVGKIPEDWDVTRLGNIGKFSSSGIDKKTLPNQPLVKMINYMNIYGNKDKVLDDKREYMVVSVSEEQKEKHPVKKGDLIFTPSSETEIDIGLSAVIDCELPNTVFSYHVLRFEFKNEVNHSYKKYLCNNPNVLFYFSANCKGTTRQILGRDEFRNALVILPPLKEQEIISKYLDKYTLFIEKLVSKKEKLIELLKEKRQSLINNSVTKGINTKAKMKDSGIEWIGFIPEKWETSIISRICDKITNGYVGPTRDILKDKGIRYIQSLHIKNNQIIFNHPYYVSEEWSNEHSRSILQKNDILIVQTGDIGQVAVVNEEFVGCNCHALILITPKKTINSKFFSFLLNSNFGFHSLKSIQTGALHPHLNSSNVKEIFIPIPPLPEQQQIVYYIETETSKIDKTVSKIEKEIELLNEYKTSLIYEAVTGKIDLRSE